ncbi:MAG: hypothetical protein COA86_05835 [Kangiella sp.]|nr:MAG: hypothetical protein COA86_05835 [Kangiella sp.]
MIQLKKAEDLSRLRRIALDAQGLLKANPFGSGLVGACKAINHLGYVQLDTISVVERAHHHVFYSRVPKFKPAMINQMLLDGNIFEYWSHAAAVIPINDFRFSLPYKHAIKSGQTHWYKNSDKKLMGELLKRIRSEGPLRSRDVEARPKTKKQSGWWDWKPAKKALEQLYMQGDLMVSNREGFQKIYDLTERVLPSNVDSKVPSMDEFATHIVDQQLRCHGFASLKGLTYLRRNTELRKAVKILINERLARGTFEQIKVSGGEIFILETGALERRLPRLNNRMLILSPFDNSVIQRDRLKSIFQYNYQIECYVPEAKRQYGYFCLPLLYQGEFIGRMDAKAHRKTNHFEIKALYFELDGFEQNDFNEDLIIKAFVGAVTSFCYFQNCETVSLTKANPKYLTQRLQIALKLSVGDNDCS